MDDQAGFRDVHNANGAGRRLDGDLDGFAADSIVDRGPARGFEGLDRVGAGLATVPDADNPGLVPQSCVGSRNPGTGDRAASVSK